MPLACAGRMALLCRGGDDRLADGGEGMSMIACPPTLSLPHAGGGKPLSCSDAPYGRSDSLPPTWGRDGVGGLA